VEKRRLIAPMHGDPREYLKSNMYISGNMASADAINTISSTVASEVEIKVTKGSRYYYRHREEILASRKEKRMEDDDFKQRYEERERKKSEKERKEKERAEMRELKKRITEGLPPVRPKLETIITRT